MSDTINRQDALDKAILIPIAKIVTEDKIIYRKVVFVDDIEKLTSAERRGKWEYGGRNIYGYDYYFCSECGYSSVILGWNYCPNCGADMRGEQNERHDIQTGCN